MEKLHAIIFLYFVVFAPITFQCVESETFFIMATSEKPCFEYGGNNSSLGSRKSDEFDEEPECLTLQQFMTRFKKNGYQNLINITLELDQGEHSLNYVLSIFDIPFFMMRSDAAATVICSQPGVRLQLHYIEDVVIGGTTFIGCEEIEVSFVDQFRFENSSFQSSPNGSLTLNHTMNATITGSSFLEITQRHCDKAAMTITNSSVLIQYCTFSHSEASIYSTLSDTIIDSCTFVNNTLMGCDQEFRSTPIITVLNGPRTSRSATITNSDFIDNRKVSDNRIDITFILVDGSILAQNNNFVNNTEFEELLYVNTDYNQVIMDHNNISNNKIYPAIFLIDGSNMSITISDNHFVDNSAVALLLRVSDSTVTINDSYFFGNRGTFHYGNGAVAIGFATTYRCSSNISVTITGCTFVHNYPPTYVNKLFQGAVGVCMDTGPVSVVQSTFINNLASYVGGAALRINTNSSVLIDSCTFIENKGPRGGAVRIERASSILINRTDFINNQGNMDSGGALYMDVHNAVIVINGSYFYGNLNNRLNWTDSKSFYGYAGTVYLEGKHNSLIIDKSSFVNNVVNAIDGGTLYAFGSQTGRVVILHSNFTNTTTSGPPYQLQAYGGLVISSDTVKIAETTFINNSAGECGALSMQVHNIDITDSHFVHNSALYYSGGTICTFQRLHRMTISNCTFSHNYARKDGGVLRMLYDDRTTIDISECIFDNNIAGLQGSVIWTVPLETFYITNSLFIKNQAGSDGGVMVMSIRDHDYSVIHGQLIISGSSFNQNKASGRGGVFSSFVPCKYIVDNSSFTGNQAGIDGGVMYVGSGNSLVRISDGSTFSFNNATDQGGVISINRSRLEISNTAVFNNNFAGIGDNIIACNCDMSAAVMLQNYTDPNFPNCTIYGHYDVTTADSLPTKPAGYVVAMAVSIPIAIIVILLLLTATLLGAYMCFCRRRYLLKQYGVRRLDHPDFVPLMNNT